MKIPWSTVMKRWPPQGVVQFREPTCQHFSYASNPGQNDIRKMYQKIKNIKNGYSQQPQLCKDLNGVVLAEEEQCIERWTEYYKSLLGQSELPEDEAEPDIQFSTQFVAESRMLFSSSRITKPQGRTTYLANFLNMEDMNCVLGY